MVDACQGIFKDILHLDTVTKLEKEKIEKKKNMWPNLLEIFGSIQIL